MNTLVFSPRQIKTHLDTLRIFIFTFISTFKTKGYHCICSLYWKLWEAQVFSIVVYFLILCGPFALVQENKNITKMRLAYISGSPQNLGRFTVLVRAIPWSGKSYSDSVTQFFTNYYSSSYISHQIVYLPGTVRKLVVSTKVNN